MSKPFRRKFNAARFLNVEEMRQSIGRDPILLLNNMLVDANSKDDRATPFAADSLEEFIPEIEKGVALYQAGGFRELAWFMFALGRQTAYIDYWPLLKDALDQTSYKSAGISSADHRSGQTTKKKQIAKLAPTQLRTFSKPEAIRNIAEMVDCSESYVRKTLKEIDV